MTERDTAPTGSAPTSDGTAGGRVTVTWHDRTVVLTVDGDLDVVTEPEVVAAAARATALPGVTSLVVRLDRCTFCDARGLASLVRARAHAHGAGLDFGLAEVPAGLVRLLTITGLASAMPTRASTDGVGPASADSAGSAWVDGAGPTSATG